MGQFILKFRIEYKIKYAYLHVYAFFELNNFFIAVMATYRLEIFSVSLFPAVF